MLTHETYKDIFQRRNLGLENHNVRRWWGRGIGRTRGVCTQHVVRMRQGRVQMRILVDERERVNCLGCVVLQTKGFRRLCETAVATIMNHVVAVVVFAKPQIQHVVAFVAEFHGGASGLLLYTNV